LNRSEYSADQWRSNGNNNFRSKCKICVQEEEQIRAPKDENWFETFQQDHSSFLTGELCEPSLIEYLHNDFVFEENYTEKFTWLETAAYRDPIDTQELLTATNNDGTVNRVTPLNFILTCKPPLYTVHAFVRGNPDSILGLLNTTKETPLCVACQHGAVIPVIKYLLKATIAAFKQHNFDDNPIGFLMDDFNADAYYNHNSEIVEALFQGMVLQDGNTYGGTTFCSLTFFLRHMTRALFPLWLKDKHASKIVDRILLFLLKEGQFVSKTWEPFMFHNLLSGIWPACIKSVAFEIIIEKCVDLCNIKEDGPLLVPSVLTTVVDGRLPLHLAIANKYPLTVVESILRKQPCTLEIRDLQTRLYPFQLAACNNFSTTVTSGEWEIMHAGQNSDEAADWQIIYEDHVGRGFLQNMALNSFNVCYLLLRENPTLVSY